MMRRFATYVGAALLLSLGAIAATARLGRDWEARVAVRGHSMEPTLFDGDWLLVDPKAYEERAPRPGELVAALDPRDKTRVIVKRVVTTLPDGSTRLGSEHAAHGDDDIGPVLVADVLGRPWFRYWPQHRVGHIS
jgi:hypothetical protein